MNETIYSKKAKEFRDAYSLGNSMTRSSLMLSTRLISEEFKEVLEAADLCGKDMWLRPTGAENRLRENLLKELTDLVYVCHQMAASFNWNLDESYVRVHESNMSKLDEEGKPIYREDGKIMKGPNYFTPTLTDLIQ